MNLDQYVIEDAATEGLIFNKKDLAINIHNWKPGEKNILFVTGISGGGKSTLAKDYANKYHAISIELDRLMYTYQFIGKNHYDRADEALINDYYREYPATRTPKEMTYTEWRTFLFGCFKYLIKRMHADAQHLYVVEGIQLVPIALGDVECGREIFSSPILIKNTSLLTSLLRRAKRDVVSADSIESVPMLFKMLNWYIGETKNLEKFSRLCKEATIHPLEPYMELATENVMRVLVKKISESASENQIEATKFKRENVDWHRGRALSWQYFMTRYHINIDTCSDSQRQKLRDELVKSISADIKKSDPTEPNSTIDKLNKKYRDMINARILNFYLTPDETIEFDITL